MSPRKKWVPGIFPGGLKVHSTYGWQPDHLHVPNVWKSGSLNLLEPSPVCNRPVQGLLYRYLCHKVCIRSDNKVCELIAVKVQHNSLLNSTVVAFRVLPCGSYALIPAPSPLFQTILELILWNGLQSCHCITPDVSMLSKSLPFNISFISGNRKSHWGLDLLNRQGVPTQ